MTITRILEIDDLTPREIATLFAGLHSGAQAEFFAHVWDIARDWPGAGWCQQSHSIANALTNDGREAIKVLAGHALEEQKA